jgi:hypothetical protein
MLKLLQKRFRPDFQASANTSSVRRTRATLFNGLAQARGSLEPALLLVSFYKPD